MKRLIFCFDGTWNKLLPDVATNVVLTAASIDRLDPAGVPQVIHYDEGVGTGDLEQIRGGVFGYGLMDNVREAYRFLVFNYDPGDEIFVFGFSRGAFSARTFIGFMRHVGPLHRLHIGRIDEAVTLYEDRLKGKDGSTEAMRRFRAMYSDKVCIGQRDEDWRCSNIPDYVSGSAPLMKIKYLGVWDTVEAMGIPDIIPGSDWFNREYDYHDASLDAFVENARHAVAIDESRTLFPLVRFDDVEELNASRGYDSSDDNAPYQERWFPGVHGSVGGGGDIRGLSDDALMWILSGAKQAGLQLDTARGTRIHGLRPDPFAPLVNEADPEFSVTGLIKSDRDGPQHLWQLSRSAIRRWRTPANALGGKTYRPGTLDGVRQDLEAMGSWSFEPPTDLVMEEKVGIGDTLSEFAHRHYGDAELWPEIYEANRDRILDEDEIFPGLSVRIPRRPPE
ncbi:MAG: DUF2235 domain-containing protein [Alphaproteobacteria bacterium]|nr:DUF2235 domain-containing protein [Alphaproteobacteria bacterium]